ncbi:SAM-dependent methyltransferase [Actibacterium mucosum KCTC 23349]|uniref:Release factor glutamine methyltransferase n=1 Tax=Actibacterium mucosum KCTC 23349 TaxID=1454373 RepID=A0A037ZLA7_9RHOB|nr:peptide chain release factor N(5)-glutamine methyltransferase [Actibacterium mucosum]KAJ55626.1 SAM-dependent methyltransferase [Actibacterium mucosum KCTC 23349]
MRVQDGLRALIDHLNAANIPDAPRDARIIMAAVLGVDRSRLTLAAGDPLNADVQKAALAMAARRAAREPLSHIVGHRAFYGRTFRVSSDVLDPRPETETLIAAALQVAFTKVLDLGTGTGAILLTLLAERAEATGLGTDLSDAALCIARENAKALGLSTRADLRQSDWFLRVTGRFDLIVSNPPYIALDEMQALQPEVREHEPRMALTDEGDGLSAYRTICDSAPAHLAPGGHLMVEIGPTQATAVCAMMQRAGLETITVHNDLDGRDRVVAAKAPG